MKKIIYLITEDWFFVSHFLDRALLAKKSGLEVIVATRLSDSHHKIINSGFRFVDISFNRGGINFINDFKTLLEIFNLFKKEKPDIVHQIAVKPIIYGSFVSLFFPTIRVLNAPVGMGFVFSSRSIKAMLLRPLITFCYKFLLAPSAGKVIFENSDDMRDAINRGYATSKNVVLIRGAGVDIQEYVPTIKLRKRPVVVLVSRMLRDKGVLEFIKAAAIINSNGKRADFLLVGNPDPCNPSSLSLKELGDSSGKFGVQWIGFSNNVREIYACADIACLPSYREGLPKSLLEAAASGLPIVATNAVGCREVVIDGVTGILVPIGDVISLAIALEKLILSPELREKMGQSGRKLVEDNFSSKKISEQTFNLYKSLL